MDWPLRWQSTILELAIGSRQVSHYLCRYSTISWGAEELSWGLNVSQISVSYRMRVLWKGTKHGGSWLRHGLSFSFSSLLDDGASGRFLCFSLSQQFPIYAFLVDMGGGKQGGDSDNMTDRPWMGETAEREGSPGG